MAQIKNTIKATIPFSFKGIEYKPSSIIDLDAFANGEQTIDNIFQLVANENNVNKYSYEYEVLESSAIYFSDPTGIASNFMSNNYFDLKGFKQSLNEAALLNTLQTIAKHTMNIENLEEHETLKLALEEAYQAGKNS